MDLRVLRTFIRVAETGTLTEASVQLRLAQPALSRHIKLLENELGVQLFDRSPRGMRLTGAGESLLRRISGPVRQIDQSVVELRSMADGILSCL
jgi:DNA-binding transcriptional LysR family regulator